MENGWKKKLGVSNGERKRIIVTSNVDGLRNKETRKIIARRLKKMKIDISTIQETPGEQRRMGRRKLYLLHNSGKKE